MCRLLLSPPLVPSTLCVYGVGLLCLRACECVFVLLAFPGKQLRDRYSKIDATGERTYTQQGCGGLGFPFLQQSETGGCSRTTMALIYSSLLTAALAVTTDVVPTIPRWSCAHVMCSGEGFQERLLGRVSPPQHYTRVTSPECTIFIEACVFYRPLCSFSLFVDHRAVSRYSAL